MGGGFQLFTENRTIDYHRRFGRLGGFFLPTVRTSVRVVDEKLKLSDDQKSKLREIAEATENSVAGADDNDASEQGRTDARSKRALAHKENMTKAWYCSPTTRRRRGRTDRRADQYRLSGAAVEQLIVRPPRRSEFPDPRGMAHANRRGFLSWGEHRAHQRVTASDSRLYPTFRPPIRERRSRATELH